MLGTLKRTHHARALSSNGNASESESKIDDSSSLDEELFSESQKHESSAGEISLTSK